MPVSVSESIRPCYRQSAHTACSPLQYMQYYCSPLQHKKHVQRASDQFQYIHNITGLFYNTTSMDIEAQLLLRSKKEALIEMLPFTPELIILPTLFCLLLFLPHNPFSLLSGRLCGVPVLSYLCWLWPGCLQCSPWQTSAPSSFRSSLLSLTHCRVLSLWWCTVSYGER